MAARWVVVDELVHELGSLRAIMQDVEAQPDLAASDLAVELRGSLDRAADTIHQVIGGDETMLAQARRAMAEAQQVAERARAAVGRSRAARNHAGQLSEEELAHRRVAGGHIEALKRLRPESGR